MLCMDRSQSLSRATGAIAANCGTSFPESMCVAHPLSGSMKLESKLESNGNLSQKEGFTGLKGQSKHQTDVISGYVGFGVVTTDFFVNDI